MSAKLWGMLKNLQPIERVIGAGLTFVVALTRA